jgi:hypothetical protein
VEDSRSQFQPENRFIAFRHRSQAKAGNPEQLQVRPAGVSLATFRMKIPKLRRREQLKSQVKIVKRNQGAISIDRLAEAESKPVELSAREMTLVVKQWIAEFKERKRSHRETLAPLQIK